MVKIIVGDRVGKLGHLTVGCSAAVFDYTTKKILLARRNDNDKWCVPGGYMEAGENFSEGCAREVLEETGLRVQVTKLIGIYTTPHRLLEYADGNRWQLVVLHFEAEVQDGEIRTSDETSDLKFFSPSETTDLQMSDLDRRRVQDSFANRSTAFIHNDFTL